MLTIEPPLFFYPFLFITLFFSPKGFGVAFGATLMDAQPYAIIVEAGGKVSERQLAKESPGTQLPTTVSVVSSKVEAGVRTVVLTRPRALSRKPYVSQRLSL